MLTMIGRGSVVSIMRQHETSGDPSVFLARASAVHQLLYFAPIHVHL